jgi:hypothetical protein
MKNEYDNDAMLTREYQRESRQREYIRRDARTMVLATIDELNQYLLGNVTLEAATDAARELTHKLNASYGSSPIIYTNNKLKQIQYDTLYRHRNFNNLYNRNPFHGLRNNRN